VLVPSSRIVAFLRALLAPRGGRPAPSALDRVLVGVAAAICLFFAASLRDVASSFLIVEPPRVPTAQKGDAAALVRVRTADKTLVPGAVVRVFAVAEGNVLLAGDGRTNESGEATFDALPRGETWIVAYAAGHARASTRLFLEEPGPAGRRTVDLVLVAATLLEVRVIDAQNQPTSGVEVQASSSDPLAHVARTGADGIARFERLPQPPFTVDLSVAGYEPIRRTGVFPAKEPLTLKLERLGGFDVRVEDPDGQPARGAEVLISGPGLWPARSTATNDDGIAAIVGLRAGVYDLKARRGDLVSKTDVSIPLKKGQTIERTLRLERGRPIRVRVTDGPAPENGEAPPVADARVVLVEEGLSSFPMEGRTDAKGEVSLGPAVEGGATITARAEGFVPRSVPATAGDDGVVEIPLMRGGTLSGDVVDARGFAVDGATIEVIGTDMDGMPIQLSGAASAFAEDLFAFNLTGPQPLIARGELGVMPGPVPDIPHGGGGSLAASKTTGEPWVTRIDGTFVATPIPPGRVHVLVRHPDYIEEVSDVVALAAGGEKKLHIVLGEGGRLEGRVREEDRAPVAGARIELAAATGTFEAVTYTVDDGTFSVAAVPPDVVITVYRPDDPSEVAARIAVDVPPREKREVDIVLPKLRDPVSIRVVDDRGYPVVRAMVRATSLDVDTALEKTLFTDDDGMIELRDARGLPLRLVLEHPGHAPLTTTLDPAEKEHRIVMTDGLVVRGTVTARDGRDKLEGADVSLYTATGARHATTDRDGSFELRDMAEGRVRIVATAEGHARAEAVVFVEGDKRHAVELPPVDLSRAGEVIGLVVDANGEGVAGARVAMDAVPTWLPVGRLPPTIAQTDKEGRFKLGGLPEGKVTLVAYSPELGRGLVEGIEVREGRTTDRVKIEIPDQDYSVPKRRGAGSVAVTLADREGAIVVVDVPAGGEAEAAGIEPEDRLVAIGGIPLRSIEDARQRLSGPLSQDLVVEVVRRGKVGDDHERLRVRREVTRR
jgi:hypothetical protein